MEEQQQKDIGAEDVQALSEPRKKRKVSNLFLQVLGGDFLTREWARHQLNYLFFLALLGMLYIANSYFAESTSRSIDEVARELKELQYEYVSTKSELMQAGKQSELARKLETTGIVESTEPVRKLIVSNKK
jgi:hypothetical protein